MDFDYLLINGTVVDGTGNPPFRARVGIAGDRLRIIRGATDVAAAHVYDIDGCVIAPGFIDMHSHTGLLLLEQPVNEAKIRQGVTTEIVGVDGLGYAPFFSKAELQRLVRYNSGLDGRPDVEYDWSTVEEYLARLDRKAAVNVAYLVGNSALRILGLGWEPRRPSAGELANMSSALEDALAEGAFGLSTGLDYPPGSHADTDELVALSQVVARMGGIYHTHVRYQLGDRYLDPFREAVEIGERSGCPVHLTHLYRRTSARGGSAPLLELVDDAVGRGMEVTFDTYPWEWSGTRLPMLLPLWSQEGTPDQILARLTDRRHRGRLRVDVDARGESYAGADIWGRIRLCGFTAQQNRMYEGWTLQQVMSDMELPAADTIVELLVSEDFGVSQVAPGPHGASVPAFLVHPRGMIGSDSVFVGEYPSPRSYGTFPRVLGEFVREERALSLEDAVRKMTSLPANRLGLVGRGLVKDDFFADLVVFDPRTVKHLASYETPRVYPEGIHHVFVNGVPTLLDDKSTSQCPGRALRRR